jgi:hypothetical protein
MSYGTETRMNPLHFIWFVLLLFFWKIPSWDGSRWHLFNCLQRNVVELLHWYLFPIDRPRVLTYLRHRIIFLEAILCSMATHTHTSLAQRGAGLGLISPRTYERGNPHTDEVGSLEPEPSRTREPDSYVYGPPMIELWLSYRQHTLKRSRCCHLL